MGHDVSTCQCPVLRGSLKLPVSQTLHLHLPEMFFSPAHTRATDMIGIRFGGGVLLPSHLMESNHAQGAPLQLPTLQVANLP